MNSYLLLLCLAFLSGALTTPLNSRCVFRSGEGGAVSLIELNVKGTIHGRCSFRHEGEDVTVTYEDTNGKLVAKSMNSTVVDPIGKAKSCRQFAAQKPATHKHRQTRSDFPTLTPETELELFNRMQEYEKVVAANQEYVDSLKPKFFGLFTNLFSNTASNAIGLSFGSPSNNLFPGFNVGVPTFTNVEATIGSSYNTPAIFKWFGIEGDDRGNDYLP